MCICYLLTCLFYYLGNLDVPAPQSNMMTQNRDTNMAGVAITWNEVNDAVNYTVELIDVGNSAVKMMNMTVTITQHTVIVPFGRYMVNVTAHSRCRRDFDSSGDQMINLEETLGKFS